jgi:hypothetical protein
MGHICTLHSVEEIHKKVYHSLQEIPIHSLRRSCYLRPVLLHESEGSSEDGAACGQEYRFCSTESTFRDLSTRRIQFSRSLRLRYYSISWNFPAWGNMLEMARRRYSRMRVSYYIIL